MSLFEKIFGKKELPEPKGEYQGYFKLLNGYEPHFTRWGGSIYESELVRAAINTIATHVSKLKVDVIGSAKPKLQNKLKHGPNELQTWSQFLYRLASILFIHNTAFICPVLDTLGEISGVISVLPDRCTVVQYNGVPYLRYEFSRGQHAAIELDYCGIMTRFQYRDDLFGETNGALRATMELINLQNQGIEEGVKNSARYQFIAQLSNFSKAEDLKKERQRFTAENLADADGGGLLLFPNTYSNIQQVKMTPYAPDAEQMKLINKSIYEYFGVNEAVLSNAAYGDAWSAFYEGQIEPFAIQFSEVMSKMLFTYRERSEGNRVIATANRLQYMSNKDKLEVSAAMLDRGIMSINDVREIWQLPPVKGGDVRIIRGEYYNTSEKVEGEDNNE